VVALLPGSRLSTIVLRYVSFFPETDIRGTVPSVGISYHVIRNHFEPRRLKVEINTAEIQAQQALRAAVSH
jgi:hypothetical protein